MVLLPFIAAIVFAGVYPKPMLDRIEPSVDSLMEHVQERSIWVEPTPPAAHEGEGG